MSVIKNSVISVNVANYRSYRSCQQITDLVSKQ